MKMPHSSDPLEPNKCRSEAVERSLPATRGDEGVQGGMSGPGIGNRPGVSHDILWSRSVRKQCIIVTRRPRRGHREDADLASPSGTRPAQPSVGASPPLLPQGASAATDGLA
jgi:hypothetical protein